MSLAPSPVCVCKAGAKSGGHGSTARPFDSLTEVRQFTYYPQATCTVSVSTTSVAAGSTVVVKANSNLGNAIFGLSVEDMNTGHVQSETNPIFNPARPPSYNVGRGPVAWTMTAVRPTLRAGLERSGTTTSEETYDFPDTQARHLRYLGHGSSAGLCNSVAEVSIFGR